MKLIAASALLLSLCSYSQAEEASHWSAGIGSNYGGIGIKYSQEANQNVDLYANIGQSAGFAFLSYKNGVAATLGAEFAFSEDQRHTFNAALAVLDAKDHSSDYLETKDENRLTGYVVGYTYYFSGMRSTGQAVGFSAMRLTSDDEILSSLSVSWGYRF